MIIGCVHGRFQPFHNGHFEYLTAARQRCDRLIIGITQYESALTDADSPSHRMVRNDNPFSYWERLQIIKAMASEAAIEGIEVVPFPIHTPATISEFVGKQCLMFTTIYDTWNVQKIRRLKEQGFDVKILWRRRHKEFEGKTVRAAMRSDAERFRAMVPNGVSEAVDRISAARGVKVTDL